MIVVCKYCNQPIFQNILGYWEHKRNFKELASMIFNSCSSPEPKEDKFEVIAHPTTTTVR